MIPGSDAWVRANWAGDPKGAPAHRGVITLSGRAPFSVERGTQGEVLRHDRTGCEGRTLLNTVQAARIAGIARSTLYLWVQQERVEAVRTAGGQLRIFADTLFTRDPRGRKRHDRHV